MSDFVLQEKKKKKKRETSFSSFWYHTFSSLDNLPLPYLLFNSRQHQKRDRREGQYFSTQYDKTKKSLFLLLLLPPFPTPPLSRPTKFISTPFPIPTACCAALREEEGGTSTLKICPTPGIFFGQGSGIYKKKPADHRMQWAVLVLVPLLDEAKFFTSPSGHSWVRCTFLVHTPQNGTSAV